MPAVFGSVSKFPINPQIWWHCMFFLDFKRIYTWFGCVPWSDTSLCWKAKWQRFRSVRFLNTLTFTALSFNVIVIVLLAVFSSSSACLWSSFSLSIRNRTVCVRAKGLTHRKTTRKLLWPRTFALMRWMNERGVYDGLMGGWVFLQQRQFPKDPKFY